MVSLGSLGTVHEPVEVEEVTFDWFGATIRLPANEVDELELADLVELAMSTDEDAPTALVVVKDLLRQVIHADDFDLFWSTAKENKQKYADLMPVFQTLMEAAVNRPTQQPSDSSSGRLETPVNSQPISSAEVLPGRPDLVLLQMGGQQTRQELQARMAAAV